jgi:hypothetical protein
MPKFQDWKGQQANFESRTGAHAYFVRLVDFIGMRLSETVVLIQYDSLDIDACFAILIGERLRQRHWEVIKCRYGMVREA